MKNQIIQVLAIQKKSFPTPEQNMDEGRRMLDGYSGDRPDFMLLPEIFTCPYDNSCFPVFAQKDGGEVFCFLQELARKNQCYLIGGSVPEADESGRLYNTSYVFDRAGSENTGRPIFLISMYRVGNTLRNRMSSPKEKELLSLIRNMERWECASALTSVFRIYS